jgi:hypothetical protein
MRKVIEKHWNFVDEGPATIPAHGSPTSTPWVKRVVAANETGAITADGVTLALTADNEAQGVAFYHKDILSYDIDDVLAFGFVAKASVALGTNARIAMGLASAYNAAPDSVTAHAWFIAVASTAILCESDDGVTDNDDKATGLTMATSFRRFEIDFSSGLGSTTVGGTTQGGKRNIKFSMSTGRSNAMRKVATGTTFDMNGYTAGLQPYFQILKASSIDLGTLVIRSAWIRYRERP